MAAALRAAKERASALPLSCTGRPDFTHRRGPLPAFQRFQLVFVGYGWGLLESPSHQISRLRANLDCKSRKWCVKFIGIDRAALRAFAGTSKASPSCGLRRCSHV